MEWYDSYAIGIEAIDKQHQELVLMVSRLQASLTTAKINQETGNAIKFLVDYTKKHFTDEEKLMQKIDFAELENHRKQHRKLIREITDILLGLKKGKSVDVYELIDFLTDWLLNHIKYEDKKIGKAFAEFKGRSA